jgi:hypothetical protein
VAGKECWRSRRRQSHIDDFLLIVVPEAVMMGCFPNVDTTRFKVERRNHKSLSAFAEKAHTEHLR